MLKQQLEQIQNKKERATPPTPADALSRRQSFRDDAPPSKPPRPVSANYGYQAPRPEHQNHRVEGEVDLYRQGGVNALRRPYLNQTNSFREAPRRNAAPVVSRHPQLPPAAPAAKAKAKTKEVKFADASDEDDDDDESTLAAPRPRPASPPIPKKEGKKVPVQPASKNQGIRSRTGSQLLQNARFTRGGFSEVRRYKLPPPQKKKQFFYNDKKNVIMTRMNKRVSSFLL